jgi:rubrerythrin
MKKYRCPVCGYIHDEAAGVKWEDVSGDYKCPICGAPKSVFIPLDEDVLSSAPAPVPVVDPVDHDGHPLRGLSFGTLSAICSNLAKGCEKQLQPDEMEAFTKLADYYKAKAGAASGQTLRDAATLLEDDFAAGFPSANAAAKSVSDRGALRSLVWSEKVSAMVRALLDRFEKEGEAMLVNTKIYVCDICGFIYIGDVPPAICPVCKVPNHKIVEVERR